MKRTQLNSLVVSYQQTQSDETFRSIYAEMTKWQNFATIAHSLRATEADTEALYADTLWKCTETYDGNRDFRQYFQSCVKNARATLYRKQRHLREWETFDENDVSIFDFIPLDVDLDVNMKEADQRQLVDLLTKDADELTTAIVKTSLTYRPDEAVGRPLTLAGYVAKVTGIDKRKVSRIIESLAGKFDTTVHGNHRDYFAS